MTLDFIISASEMITIRFAGGYPAR